MSTDTTTTTTPAVEALLAEYDNLAARVEQATERQAQIKALLAEQLPDGTTEAAGHKVIVTVPRRLDSKALERAYPVTAYPHLYAPALSTKAVRDNLAPVDLEQYTTAGARQVSIR